MRSVTAQRRRADLVRRHWLDGSAATPVTAVRAVVAVHATDPASVYLAVLARSAGSTISDIASSMYVVRALVRWMAMRRTLFVIDRADAPLVQASVSTPLADALRRRLVGLLQRNGVEPPPGGDLGDWLAGIEDRVEGALMRGVPMTGAELRGEISELGSVVPARTRSETPVGLTSPLMTVMSARGRVVRGDPVGAWTTRNHRWEHVSSWWPDGLNGPEPVLAQAVLARRWLEQYGPATAEDLQWWTGWNKAVTGRALSALDLEEVDLDGRTGIDLPGRAERSTAPPVAALLPALDPTPMGWRHRAWFTAVPPAMVYDGSRNIGPTVWWDGEMIGGWASTPGGIRTRILADRGREAADAVDAAAERLHHRIGDAVIVPAARTPLERRLSAPR